MMQGTFVLVPIQCEPLFNQKLRIIFLSVVFARCSSIPHHSSEGMHAGIWMCDGRLMQRTLGEISEHRGLFEMMLKSYGGVKKSRQFTPKLRSGYAIRYKLEPANNAEM